MARREQWDNRMAFVLAAIGSAIGLGNIWRFPYVCYENGGGAFLVAYLVALFTAGIPLLVLEFGIGHQKMGSAPKAFREIKPNFEWFGWVASLVGFGVVVYYAVIMSYSANYLVASFTEAWGDDPSGFFYSNTLGLTDGPFSLGSFKPLLFLGLVVSWIWIVLSIWKGTKTVSKVVYVTVLLPWLLLIVFVIRGVTLPGAMEGLEYYLAPDFSRLLEPGVWAAAYTQVFFSLSVGFGIMIAYGSFLGRKSDIVNNAFIIGLADSFTAFCGGLAVFGALGFHAHSLRVPVAEAVTSGPGLAFVTYPTIISALPFASLFGVLFFLMLLTLAIDSAFSMTEATASGLKDRFGIKHRTANLSIAGTAILLALPLTFGAGLYWLDIADRFLSQFGLMLVCFGEAIIIGWLYGADKIRDHVNPISEFRVGNYWKFCVKVIAPIFLVWLVITELVERINAPYGDYPRWAEFIAGWLVVALIPILGFILMFIIRARNREAS